MSGVNGRADILKIDRKGRRWFQLGDPPEPPAALADAAINQQTQIFLAEYRAERNPEKRHLMLCNIAPGEIADYIRQTVACEPVEIDVVAVHDARCRIEDKYLIPAPGGGMILDPARLAELREEKNAFVCGLFGNANFSGAEILEFLHRVSKEVDALRPFFEKPSPSEPSSQGSTELIFSQ